VQPENGLGVVQDRLPLGGEIKPAPLMDENGLAGKLLEALQLKRDRRLGSAQHLCGLGDAPGLDHRNQGAEHPDIQADEVHAGAHAVKARRFPCKFRAAVRRRPAGAAIKWAFFLRLASKLLTKQAIAAVFNQRYSWSRLALDEAATRSLPRRRVQWRCCFITSCRDSTFRDDTSCRPEMLGGLTVHYCRSPTAALRATHRGG
jgi:hypothetical protein